jgi:hypothetical protein
VGLARAGRPHQQRIPRLIEEATRGQVKDLTSWDHRVELPVELIEWLQITEAGERSSAFELAMITNGNLVLEDEFKEVEVCESVGLGFLEANIQRAGQARKAKLSKGRSKVIVHQSLLRWKACRYRSRDRIGRYCCTVR